MSKIIVIFIVDQDSRSILTDDGRIKINVNIMFMKVIVLKTAYPR
jgi:hypothetical protein